MTVTFSRVGTGVGSTSGAVFSGTAFPQPTAGQGLLAIMGWGNATNKPPTLDANLFPGWTRYDTTAGGDSTWGAGTGPRGLSFFWKEADGSETTLTLGHGDTADANRTMYGYVATFDKSLSTWVKPTLGYGADTNIADAISAVLSSPGAAAVGDHVVAACAVVPSTANPSMSLAWGTGISGALTSRITGNTTSGNDVRVNVGSRDIPAASSGSPTITATAVAAGMLAVMLLKDTSVAPPAKPVVDAGPDQTVEPWATVNLTASSSTGSVTWSQVSGPAVGSELTGLSTSFVAPASLTKQTLVLRATAINASGATYDDVSITVGPATRATITGVPIRRATI